MTDREITVEQRAHVFRFGNIGFDFVALANGETKASPNRFGGASLQHARQLVAAWFAIFNTATLPFYRRTTGSPRRSCGSSRA